MKKETLEEVKCIAGCKYFYGREVRHHKDCIYYPESFSKLYDDLKQQQERSYSEKDVLWMLLNNPYKFEKNIKYWFEQFKKK